MLTLGVLAVLSAIALGSQAIISLDGTLISATTLPPTAAASTHLMLLFGLSGIAMLGNRLTKAEPAPAFVRGPNPFRRIALGHTSAVIAVGIISLVPSIASALTITSLVISEVMINPAGGDNQREWVELYNGTGADIDLGSYSIGWGGADYTSGTLQLSGIIASGATFVTGGPISNAGNGNPTYDLALDFGPNLGNGGIFADGIALFDTTAAAITTATVPIDAMLYGFFNINGLIDESGAPGTIDFTGFTPSGSSLELTDAGWVAQGSPTPGVGPVVTPEPGTAISLGLGLAMLAGRRRR